MFVVIIQSWFQNLTIPLNCSCDPKHMAEYLSELPFLDLYSGAIDTLVGLWGEISA